VKNKKGAFLFVEKRRLCLWGWDDQPARHWAGFHPDFNNQPCFSHTNDNLSTKITNKNGADFSATKYKGCRVAGVMGSLG
jgi:hypothetical protein